VGVCSEGGEMRDMLFLLMAMPIIIIQKICAVNPTVSFMDTVG
jgi:hypothetical protein